MDPSPIFLTVPETAAMLRTTKKAVYLLIERGQLAGVARLGRRILVRRDVLLASLAASSAPATVATDKTNGRVGK